MPSRVRPLTWSSWVTSLFFHSSVGPPACSVRFGVMFVFARSGVEFTPARLLSYSRAGVVKANEHGPQIAGKQERRKCPEIRGEPAPKSDVPNNREWKGDLPDQAEATPEKIAIKGSAKAACSRLSSGASRISASRNVLRALGIIRCQPASLLSAVDQRRT